METWRTMPVPYILPHLQLSDKEVQTVKLCLTQQRGVCLWWHLVHHPITQEGQDAGKVFRIPAQEVLYASRRHMQQKKVMSTQGMLHLSMKTEPSACVSMRKRPLNSESKRESGCASKTLRETSKWLPPTSTFITSLCLMLLAATSRFS